MGPHGFSTVSTMDSSRLFLWRDGGFSHQMLLPCPLHTSDKREEAETCVASIIVCHAIIVNEVTVFAIGRDRTVVLTFLMSFACSGETNSKLSS